MDEPPPRHITAIDIFVIGICLVPLIRFPIFIAGCGLVAGAGLILAIVRRTSRRDDPRHTKQPPGGP